MRYLLHAFICWYLERVNCFHHFPYGPRGRYVVIMSENQYHRWAGHGY